MREPLAPFLVEEDGEEGKVLRYRKKAVERGGPSEHSTPPAVTRERPKLPVWLREPAPVEQLGVTPLSPSSAFDEEIGSTSRSGASAAARQRALRRGRLVHRLLQALPDIPMDRRADAADRFLAGAAEGLPAPERADIARQVFAVLGTANFAQVFAPGGRPEVPVVGRLAHANGRTVVVAGQVDRLIVTADAVLIADYKTDRKVPESVGDVEPYVAQLALYRAVLTRLYPDKTVRAALVFTQGPALVEVPAVAMDEALEAVLRQDLTKS